MGNKRKSKGKGSPIASTVGDEALERDKFLLLSQEVHQKKKKHVDMIFKTKKYHELEMQIFKKCLSIWDKPTHRPHDPPAHPPLSVKHKTLA